MYQAESLEARFVLTDEQYGRLQADSSGIANRPVEVIWNVGGIDYRFPATIDRIGAEIASARGGIEVFATIGEADHAISLRPGAFVEIIVPDRKFSGHVQLTDSSIYDTNTVYVVENGELVARTVTIAAYDGDYVIISEGLKPGEEVLVTRISEISEGLKVRKEGDSSNRGDDAGNSAREPAQGEG
jgi:multidrug efflux pump subunit AcrA (membrane-fusion protein)